MVLPVEFIEPVSFDIMLSFDDIVSFAIMPEFEPLSTAVMLSLVMLSISPLPFMSVTTPMN